MNEETQTTDKRIDIPATITRWFAGANDGDWVGVFENADLGHRDLGARVGFMFDADQWRRARIGQSTAPDRPSYGLGWRYVLVAKCMTPVEAIAELEDGRTE